MTDPAEHSVRTGEGYVGIKLVEQALKGQTGIGKSLWNLGIPPDTSCSWVSLLLPCLVEPLFGNSCLHSSPAALPHRCAGSYNADSHFFVRVFIRCHIHWLFLPPIQKHFDCSSIIYSGFYPLVLPEVIPILVFQYIQAIPH